MDMLKLRWGFCTRLGHEFCDVQVHPEDFLGFEGQGLGWILPPPIDSWIMIIIWLYIAFNRTPNIDCYWVGAVPKV